MSNKSSPQVSLIIPVYNVEKYLAECLDSVVEQTLKDIEVIIINDGSTDSSGTILNEYAEKHPGLRIVTQQNMGLGATRNVGIKMASGEFIAFLDSDDKLSPTFLERMYKNAVENDADISMCHYSFLTEKGIAYRHPAWFKNRVLPGKEALHILLHDRAYHFFAWNKLYRRSLFIDHGIEMPNICFEDIATTPKLFYFAKKVAMMSDGDTYYYRIRKGSIMGSLNSKRFADNVTALAVIKTFLLENNAYSEYRADFRRLCRKNRISIGYDIINMHISQLKGGAFGEIKAINERITGIAVDDVKLKKGSKKEAKRERTKISLKKY